MDILVEDVEIKIMRSVEVIKKMITCCNKQVSCTYAVK